MKREDSNTPSAACIDIDQAGNVLHCSGAWTVQSLSRLEAELDKIAQSETRLLKLEAAEISAMDTAGAWLLLRTLHRLEDGGHALTLQGLRPEHETLLNVIRATAPLDTEPAAAVHAGLAEKAGLMIWPHLQQAIGMLSFLGETATAIMRSLKQPSRIRWKAVLYNLENSGFNALPIVGLLAFLLGIVISYQGAGQLQRYGANIFIVDLVGLSMLRELAPLMTAIIVAGRSGSAYAAQIATMKVTEEIDALRTIGIPPMELLVLPKLLALMIALPLLSVYADLMGVLGGMVMASAQLDVGYTDFLDRFGEAVTLSAFLVGVGKAPVFAALIAMVGCFQGLQVSNGADSVGQQTTRSVVQAIFLIIVADAIFSVLFSWLKI